MITGASGFIGSRLASLLLEELLASGATDVEICCLVRKTSDTSQLAFLCQQGIIKNLCSVVPVNLCDPKELATRIPVDSVGYIYHCAAKGNLANL